MEKCISNFKLSIYTNKSSYQAFHITMHHVISFQPLPVSPLQMSLHVIITYFPLMATHCASNLPILLPIYPTQYIRDKSVCLIFINLTRVIFIHSNPNTHECTIRNVYPLSYLGYNFLKLFLITFVL